MSMENIILNHVFYQNAEKYYTRPVIAARYQPGMENGWMVRYYGRKSGNRKAIVYEGARFFPNRKDALIFIRAKGKMCVNRNGASVEIEVTCESPLPVLYKEGTDAKNRERLIHSSDPYIFLSDEADQYEYSVLEPECWIIQEPDGTVRVWDRSMGVSFFDSGLDCVYEKGRDGRYIPVTV